MSPDVGHRASPGVRRSVRRTYYDWMFIDRDPDELAKADPPPIGVDVWLKEVFGDRAKNLKVTMHPHLKRWTLYERHKDPAMGEDIWKTIWLCCDAPEEGKVPSDYVGDRFLSSFSRFLGEFRLPTKADFEEIEAGDAKKYGVDQVNQVFYERESAAEKEAERVLKDFTEDFLSYHFNMAVNEANQAAGSGQRMQSYDTVQLFSNPDRWYNTNRDGYSVRVRKGTRAYYMVRAQEICDRYNENFAFKDWLSELPHGFKASVSLLRDMVESENVREKDSAELLRKLSEEVKSPEFQRRLALELEKQEQVVVEREPVLVAV